MKGEKWAYFVLWKLNPTLNKSTAHETLDKNNINIS